MNKTRVRVTSCFLWVMLTFLGLYPSSPAKAENLIITEPTDVWFDYSETTQFIAQTYMITGYNSDPMLWLYNEAGTLLYSIDDSIGLQSYISMEVPAGRYRLRAGICCGDPNAWRTNGGWNLQYELGFNGVGSTQTTSTTSTTSTTVEPTTTTSTTSTTTSTTSTTTSTTSTTTTTLAPTTTTTSTTTTVLTTTTTTEPPTTTVLPTSTTSTTSTTVPETTTTLSPVTNTTSTSTTTTSTTMAPVPTTTTTSTSTTSTVPLTTTTTEPVQELVQVDPEVTALLGAISMLPQSEIAAAVDNIIEQGVSADEATALATNPEVLQSVTSEQAAEIFDAVEVSDLSDAQADQLVEAVQGATEEVRAEFEQQINVFGGKFNAYVPIGSVINVGQRKVLIAATGVLFVAPTVSVSSSTSGSQSSDNKSRGKK